MPNVATNYPHGLNTLVGRNQNGYITPAFSVSPWQGELNLEKSGCDGAKKSEKGWKWVTLGENPKMPYTQCGTSIKTYAKGNNDAPSVTKISVSSTARR